ncbi:hypothetical protein [Pseudomonas sp.]|uniref:hypothetical protein n=1 Tax=Pseudomonas sp. TaxID=306 RepID=UPI003FD6C186
MTTKTIKQRVAEQQKELKKAGKLTAGMSVVLGHREQAEMMKQADSAFFFDMVTGNMNLCGLPVVFKNVLDHFSVEVYEGKREFKGLSKGAL